MKAKFKRLDPQVEIPRRAHIGDAAVDLQSRIEVVIASGERVAVPTGIAVSIPEGHAGLVLPRSGHARRSGIGLVNAPGLIDAGYRGEIEVLLINHSDQEVVFHRGDRIAQLLLVRLSELEWEEAEELDSTPRGEAGFGSTGR